MALMRLYMNFREVRGPYGGSNSFLRALRQWLMGHGVHVTTNVQDRFDVALLNTLSEGLTLEAVRAIAERGIPVVHRKTGYRGRGSPEMHRMADGVVWGDRLQVEFNPWLAHSILQSHYSLDVFLAAGFKGSFTVVPNGVDESVFNRAVATGWIRRHGTSRTFWNGVEPLRVVISTWSDNYNKGFHEYLRIDSQLGARHDVDVCLVGRVPPDATFRYVRLFRPRSRERLAVLLKQAHVILQLSEHDTCSNALIEGLNCGLPAIYLDSGSHKEIAGPYGIEYRGDWWAAVEAMKADYATFVERLAGNPYRMSVVGPQYLGVLRQAMAGPAAA
ncbi:MAG: glycosyltransferase [Acidobacteriota bacterium]